MAIEIVDFPIEHGDFPHSYVSLPGGKHPPLDSRVSMGIYTSSWDYFGGFFGGILWSKCQMF